MHVQTTWTWSWTTNGVELSGLEQVVTAPCRSHDPWFSSVREELSRTMLLCRSCSHMSECLAGALARGEAAGVWGRYLVEGGSLLCLAHAFPLVGGSGCQLPGAETTRKVDRVWPRKRTVWPPRATGAAELFGRFRIGDGDLQRCSCCWPGSLKKES